MRKCTKCGIVDDGAHPQWCKKCMRESNNARYSRMSPEERKEKNRRGRLNKTKEQIKAENQRHYRKHKERMRAQQGGHNHGIIPEEYIERRSLPCEICGDYLEPGGAGRGMHIDHDHKTDTLRGTLCEQCNRGLGMYKDSPERLRAAALYLEKYLV